MTFTPLTKATSKLRLPPFAISITRQGSKRSEMVLRVLLLAEYARDKIGLNAGDMVQLMTGDAGTPDEGFMLVAKAPAGLSLRSTHSHKAVERLQIATTALSLLGAVRVGTMAPECVTFPKPGQVRFRIPAALLPPKAAPRPPKEFVQAPLPPGHPKRALPPPALPVNGATTDAPRVVISKPVPVAPIGEIMATRK